MSFRVLGLDPGRFSHLFGLSDAALLGFGARRCVVDAQPGFPDRVELRDLAIGETALLLNFEHQPARTPFRARHAIFVREGAERALDLRNELPEAIRTRTISLRAFDRDEEMLGAALAEGRALVPVIERLLACDAVAYCHAHYAAWGCYAARIERS